ncbi:unnamed protein product [Spodoptera exigua]|uniref:Uncharacterized protein n=1 Tax=Spodoptera exigua TaxID=7107 RepID=A0A922MGK9_SPOEX|nr:hypothetical protein HF086_001760 [Spodoptera exigua]CAH0701944.1 unnamed protein product [Spodoptera exigua]
MSFKDKVAIVTGSGSGMGAATALLFAEEGAHIVIVDFNEERAKNTAKSCKKLGNKVLVIIADVSKKEDDEKIINDTVEAFGRIDILVNNAGTVKVGKILDGTLIDTFDEVVNTNLRAVVVLTSLAAPHLAKTKGCVINTSSIFSTAFRYGSIFPSYCVSKAGVDAFTRVAALELASSGVRVNAVNPGPVYTNLLIHNGLPGTWEEYSQFTALKKGSDPKEVGNLILYLASDKAKSITGVCYEIDNGMNLV